jgi:hypothetical protein
MRTRHQANYVRFPACRVQLLVLFFLAVFAHGARAQGRPENSLRLPVQTPSQFAIDDFDGDNRPDFASVQVGQSDSHDARYFIHFRLTSGLPQTFGVTAPSGGLHLASRDVNGDTYPDVVVTTLWTGQPVAVLVNDGRGNFTRSEPVDFPAAFTSSEQSFNAETHTVNDATAALSPRYVPASCEQCVGSSSSLAAVGRFAATSLHLVASSGSDSFFGRAPPSVVLPN